MKRMVRAGYAALLILVTAVSTYSGPQKARETRVSAKTFRIAGVVGVEGKTLISRDRRLWNVQNASALSAAEGRRVVVKAVSETDPTSVKVLTVWIEPERTGALLSDAAFRR